MILFHEKTYEILKDLLNLYMKYVHGFSQVKIKRLLYDLLANSALEMYSIETVGRLIEWNRLQSRNDDSDENIWLNTEQIRLITHRLYSPTIYREIFLPIINRNCPDNRTINDILIYLDENVHSNDQEQVIDVQEMRTKLTLLPWIFQLPFPRGIYTLTNSGSSSAKYFYVCVCVHIYIYNH